MSIFSRKSTRLVRTAGLLTAAVLATAGLTACADNTDDEAGAGGGTASAGGTASSEAPACSPSASASAVPTADAASLLPSDIADAGTIVVGTDPTYAPNEYKDDSGQIVGFDIDLFDAVAQKLGVTAQYQESTFDNIIPSIGSKYDVGVSSFTDNCERQETVDFVTYLSAGTQWATTAAAAVDPEDACGKTVAVQTGTVQDTDDLPARNAACTAAGKAEIVVQRFDDQGLATNAVVSGQADAMLADSPITAYAVKQSGGALELAGDVYDAAPYGYAIGKDDAGLAQAIQGAVAALIADGTYAQILDTYGLADGAIDVPLLNGATG